MTLQDLPLARDGIRQSGLGGVLRPYVALRGRRVIDPWAEDDPAPMLSYVAGRLRHLGSAGHAQRRRSRRGVTDDG